MFLWIVRWIGTLVLAFIAGKLMTKIKMPSIFLGQEHGADIHQGREERRNH